MTDILLYILGALLLTYIIGIVLKRRFSRRARIYVFEAYESESGELRPARRVRKYRLYHHVLDRHFLPRLTSGMSLVPFVANRMELHGACLYARAYAWDLSRAIAVKSLSPRAECLYDPSYDGSIPNKETVVKKESLAVLGDSRGSYLFTEGSVFVLREGSRYMFFYYLIKK